MSSLFVLIPVTLVLLVVAIAAWLWSVRNGQFDDLDSEARRILFDDAPSSTENDKPSDAAGSGAPAGDDKRGGAES